MALPIATTILVTPDTRISRFGRYHCLGGDRVDAVGGITAAATSVNIYC